MNSSLSLRWRVILTVLSVSVAAVAVGYFVQSSILLPAFARIEEDQARANAARCTATLRALGQAVSQTCLDYARWDDTYQYMESRDPAYTDSNYQATTFTSNELHLILLVDAEGQVTWGGAPRGGEEEVETVARPGGLGDLAWQALIAPGPGGRQGIEQTEDGLMLVAAWPITRSDGGGEPRGAVVMARRLDDASLAQLTARTRVRFTLRAAEPGDERLGSESEARVEAPAGRDDILLASSTYPDVSGRPAVVITAEQPRTASRVGRAAARVALTSIALASLAGLVLTVWVLQRTVVRPVERLGQEARRVAGAEGLTGRVTEQGSAELAHLAGAINAMLSDLERADRALRESEARMRSAFHNAAVGFALAWPNGTVSQANQRWAEMLGTTAEELARRPFSEIIHPEDAAGFHEQLQDALTRRLDGFRAEVRCLRTDGESVWTDLAVGLVHSGSGDLENVVLVIADISDRKRAEDELRSMSHRDGLTGLANRRAFEERLEREWRAATRDGGSLALLLLDVDHFKTYNDAYGHLAGDECLVQVAGALREGCRRTIDLPCRWGGEEFAVILADTGLDQALACAERIRALVEAAALPRPGQMPDHVTVSVGVAIAQPMPSAGAGGLLEAADRAMYAAKHGGRNRVAHATAEAETAEPS